MTSRREFLERSIATALSICIPGGAMSAASLPASRGLERVRFDAAGTFIVGNLFVPADHDGRTRYPAVVVGGSLASVKEQMGGTYAAELARQGFIALAIDYRHYGESGGEPRQFEQPDVKSQDLSLAAAYLASRSDVRRDAVALLGVCTSGGNVIYAAARDPSISAIAAVAGHFPAPSVTSTLPIFGGPDAVARRRAEGRAAIEKYQRTGENTLIVCYHNTDRSAAHFGPMEYYMDIKRGGGVPQWRNELSAMSWEGWLDFDPISEAPKVTTPALIVHSDGCALPEQARKVHALLRGPKALHWSNGYHFDFYDDPAKTSDAVAAIASFFREHA